MKLSAVLATVARDGNEWGAHIPIEWANGRTVFGGLQASLMVRAMRLMLGDAQEPPLRSVQLTFVAPVAAGQDVRLQPELLCKGRSTTHARCDLVSAEGLACCAVAIFGAARRSDVVIEIPRAEARVDPATLPDLPFAQGVMPVFMQHLQLRWAHGAPPYSGHQDPQSIIYARLRDEEASPEDALIALADSIPSPALSMLRTPAPAASLNWMLELLGDPADLDRTAWAMIGTEVRAGVDGYLSQTSILWGPGGHAFSVSHQSVAIFG
jgi:acyl-CoA thioesterase